MINEINSKIVKNMRIITFDDTVKMFSIRNPKLNIKDYFATR